MKKNLHIFGLCLSFLLFLTGCKGCKDNAQPEGLQFYCKIDGKAFQPKMTTDFGYKSIEAKLYNHDSVLLISADQNEKSISILLTDTLGTLQAGHDYILMDSIVKSNALYTPNSFSLSCDYRTNANCTGVCRITNLDRINKIIEGTFSFKAVNLQTADTVSITDGRFSLYYK